MRLIHASVLLGLLASLHISNCAAQGNGPGADQRLILEQVLTQNYQPSEVGKHAMGVGSDTDVRRPGIIVVVQRAGLYGSLLRSQIASSAIKGEDAKLYRGHEDYTVPPGERYYVISVHVGLSTVDIGLLSARAVSTSHGTGKVWTATTFYFTEDALANAEKDTVEREIDQWIVPEGRGAAVATAPLAQPPSPGTVAAAKIPANEKALTLNPGMSREQVLQLMGKPQREISFQAQSWLHYPGMIMLLRDGKLAEVESGGSAATASIAFRSEPSGAEVYVDGQLTGSTPATLEVPSGNHEIRMRLGSYEDWVKNVKVFGGSQTQFEATLQKK